MKKCNNCGALYSDDDMTRCTACDYGLYSYRRENQYIRSSLFKNCTIILAIIFIIAGIAAGFLFKTPGKYSFSDEKFNALLMFIVWFSGIIPVFISYAIYVHIENQEFQARISMQILDMLIMKNNSSKKNNGGAIWILKI